MPHPHPTFGILLASDVFLAKEGERTITIELICTKAFLEKEKADKAILVFDNIIYYTFARLDLILL